MTYMDRVLNAVHDDDWQAFRISMKGKTTQEKLDMLKGYWWDQHRSIKPRESCHYCIQVDNYLKALCRGGQLEAGESLQKAIDNGWDLSIRRQK